MSVLLKRCMKPLNTYRVNPIRQLLCSYGHEQTVLSSASLYFILRLNALNCAGVCYPPVV